MKGVLFTKYDEIFLEKSWIWLATDPVKSLTNTPTFTKAQQRKWFECLANKKNYFIQGVTFEGKPIGVYGIKNITEKDAEYFGYIGEVDYWGRGIGKLMVQQAIKIAQSWKLKCLYLTVVKSNERAIALYEHIGFKEISSKNTDHLLFMELKL